MRAAKADANQRAIVAALRSIGCSVQSLHRVGQGVPDLLVGYRGANWLMEVKADKGLLRATQAAWRSRWRGQVITIRSVDEALKTLTPDTKMIG